MTVKLLPEVKKLWVDALRSGRYKQGHNDLIDDKGGHCCLGVLAAELGCTMTRTEAYADVTLPDGAVVKSYGALPDALFTRIYGYDLAPYSACSDIEHHRNPRVEQPSPYGDPDYVIMLSELNDDELLSFEEIADIIEEQL